MTYELWVELWVLIFPIGYHWECICTLRMRITWPMTSIFPTYLKLLTPICLSLSNLYRCMIKINWVIPQNSLWFYVKDHIDPYAQHHVSLERRHKSISMIVLGNHSFLGRFLAIFSLHMHRNGHLWASSSNFDTGIQFCNLIFLQGMIFWQFEDVFWWFLHSICWMSTIFLFQFVLLELWHCGKPSACMAANVCVSIVYYDNKRLLMVLCVLLYTAVLCGRMLFAQMYEAVIAAFDGNKFVVKYEASTNNCEPQKTCYTCVTVCF